MWLYPMPKEEEIREVYGESYFQNENFLDGSNDTIYGYYDYLSERFTRQLHYRWLMERIRSMTTDFQKDKTTLMDVGCGFGFLLDAAQDAGFVVEGLEFNAHAVECAKKKFSFPIHTGDINKYSGPKKNVITMFDVIEHLPDPLPIVEKISQVLEPKGLFVITTMDCDSFVSRALGARLEDFRRIREHLTFYTRKSLNMILERYGFEVIHTAFHGHTFELGFLSDRIRLINKPLGNISAAMIKTFGLSSVPIHLNPRTKMIVVARRKP
jgi:2-polyprenyl-3-methyl-5-hydroxy-6-metoxy-1,4-benzoquinol methylase